MKELYIKDILTLNNGCPEIELYGWISNLQEHKTCYFINLQDSTGTIRIYSEKSLVKFLIKKEQSIYCKGVLTKDKQNNYQITATMISLIGDVEIDLRPSARAHFNVFSESYANHVVTNKHLYIRNPKNRDILLARDLVIKAVRNWFMAENYIDVTAPILTPILLYSPETGIDVHIREENAYLTQCVGFYLESAVHSLERVYNIGPSFRGAESISKRHLMEYWHIKSELAFCSFEEYFSVVESLIHAVFKYVIEYGGEELAASIGTAFCNDGLKTPFPRIEYSDAISLLNSNGIRIAFGKSLNSAAEIFLSEYFKGAVWVTHKPKEIEGFPYKTNLHNPLLTETADLIASRGMGEILGIADKITDVQELKNRLEEKGKDFEEYRWFCELREYGTVPHCGLGMGLERLIRWIFCMPHVKDVIPFPRRINKHIYP